MWSIVAVNEHESKLIENSDKKWALVTCSKGNKW
jgi:hypothetical protein